MYLKSLSLRQFRNYDQQCLHLSAAKTIIVGDNAQGKTNLLEAVELLSTLQSHRTNRDGDLVLNGETTGQIHGILERQMGTMELGLTLRRNGRRTVILNGQTQRRYLDLLGLLNTVRFSSTDLELVRGGPEQRRQWLDRLLTQLEPLYAHIWQQYQQVLRQRNALLKSHHANSTRPSQEELALWDAQLTATGIRVIRRRSRALARLSPLAIAWHQLISGCRETLEIRYLPNVKSETDHLEAWQQAFLVKIEERMMAEYHQHTSLVGPHRDDIEFTINNTPARQYGSQGQQRTLVLALKLAELELIEQIVRDSPLLLLDDVLAELDLKRQNQLLEAIQDRFQTLITTTHLGAFDAHWLRHSQVVTVESGRIMTDQQPLILTPNQPHHSNATKI
ncbi:MAG: DNA replication/repair protein RecF [Cyanobacteria bacterium WB6_1B_304]|nr:DNA replication/repair protein RecF [Cyanobacteria bacterium WB6_1B_304]